MLSITYVMVRSAEGASRTTHGGRAAPGFRFETNSFKRSQAGTHFRHGVGPRRCGEQRGGAAIRPHKHVRTVPCPISSSFPRKRNPGQLGSSVAAAWRRGCGIRPK